MATNALFLLNAELAGNSEVFTPTDKLMVSGQKLSIAEIVCPVEEK
jgi:hypothetical protein